MHFQVDFKKILKWSPLHCQKCVDKKNCDVVKLPKNPQNPLQDFWQQWFEI